MNFASGAYQIHKSRLAGKKPTDMVLVSLVGRLPDESNPTVVFNPDDDPRQFDWRWSLGLELVLVYSAETKAPARGVLSRLLEQQYKGLAQVYLWDRDRQRGWVVMKGEGEPSVFRFTVSEQRAFRGLGCY